MTNWYALQTNLTTKDSILTELSKAGFKSKLSLLLDVLTFDIKKQYLYSHGDDDSLIRGYALIQVAESGIEDIVSAITISRIGKFFNLNKQGIPRPVPNEEVDSFKRSVLGKKNDFSVGQHVVVTEGMLGGLEGVVREKKKVMLRVEISLPHRKIDQWVDILSVASLT